MNPRTYEKIKALQETTSEKRRDQSTKNKYKAKVAGEIHDLFENFLNDLNKAPAGSSNTKNAIIILAMSSDLNEKTVQAKDTIVKHIQFLAQQIRVLELQVKQRGSAETKALLQEAKDILKILNKEYVQKFQKVLEKFDSQLNPKAPQYIPEPPTKLTPIEIAGLREHEAQRKYAQDAKKMMNDQEVRLNNIKNREHEAQRKYAQDAKKMMDDQEVRLNNINNKKKL